ncbi:hypothetical protein AAHA92_05055 [Salvia divinorum]|uniref:Uncharacterized protein n=1 Tax=Salvia divinorum TaxID=28513 RepID=A0ABD1I185_SALDI
MLHFFSNLSQTTIRTSLYKSTTPKLVTVDIEESKRSKVNQKEKILLNNTKLVHINPGNKPIRVRKLVIAEACVQALDRQCNTINTYATDFDHGRNNGRMQIVNQGCLNNMYFTYKTMKTFDGIEKLTLSIHSGSV